MSEDAATDGSIDPTPPRKCWYCFAHVPGTSATTPCPSCGRTEAQQSPGVKIPPGVSGERPEGVVPRDTPVHGGAALALAILSLLMCTVNCSFTINGFVILGWGFVPALVTLVLTGKRDLADNGMLKAAQIVAIVGLILNVTAFIFGVVASASSIPAPPPSGPVAPAFPGFPTNP